ncbi:glycoside hydrolase family 2 TIM barrel-domain containing protein, partial [Hydrogenoanaerobacterium saccharovorans]
MTKAYQRLTNGFLAVLLAAQTALPVFAADMNDDETQHVFSDSGRQYIAQSLGENIQPFANPVYAGEEWYDQIAVVQQNREPAHASFIPYQNRDIALENETSALTKDPTKSSYYQTLNSDSAWKFKISKAMSDRLQPSTGDAATRHNTENWDTAGWDTIPVPSSWQTIKDEKGIPKYDMPIYVNQKYPWRNYESVSLGEKVTAPTVYNPVGHYKRTFTLPDTWKNRNIFVSFQGVESAFYLYIDGKKVGYAEDSYTADDFNITPYLDKEKTEHTIAVEVYRWSTGSFLENQDFIRLSGIFRDVFLYSKADVEIRDFFTSTDLDDNYRDATLNLSVDVRSLNKEVSADGYTVDASLYTIEGEPVGSKFTLANGAAIAEDAYQQGDRGVRMSGSKEVTAPNLWFADSPNLYKLLLELKDANGNVVETACQRIGFREIGKKAINDAGQEQITINGKKIMFRGTNRHETDHERGRAITHDDILTDIKTMKKFNVNALRTSHYPVHPYTYELADELGIYICDEANIESHEGATGSNIPSGYPVWKNSVLDRTINMVERDKNHPSVIIWSLGNEATYRTYTMNDNYCFFVSTQWILGRDPSRIRKYERDNRYTQGTVDESATIIGDRAHSMVDVYSSQYWGVDGVEGHVKNTSNKAPYIQSEYAHSMGNALGNFKEYWDVFRSYPNAQGGFIWDWMDQSVQMPIVNTVQYTVTDKKTNTTGTVNGKLVEGRNGTLALQGQYILPAKEEHKAKSNAITLEAWVKPSGKTADSTILSKGDSGYTLKYNGVSDKMEFFVDGYTQTLMTDVPADFTNGDWHHVVATCGDGKYKLYFDGVLLGESNRNQGIYDAEVDEPIGIGYTPGMGRNFDGLIDSVRVYNRVLTAEEAKSHSIPSDDASIVYAMDFAHDEAVGESTNYPEGNYFAYGGDWGEKVTDNDFCANGLMFADRTPQPELYEVKKVHQEISFYDDGEAKDGKIRIVNEFLATNLSKYDITWKLLEDDKVLQQGRLDSLNVEPLNEKTIELGLDAITAKAGSDYILEFSASLKKDEKWADGGYEVAFEQIPLHFEPQTPQPVLDVSALAEFTAVNDTDTSITINGKTIANKDFTVVFNKNTGYIDSYTVDGTEVLKQGPVPNYWRAKISNDPGFPENLKNADRDFTVKENGILVEKSNKMISILVSGILPSAQQSENTIEYLIYSSGDIVVKNNFVAKSISNLARVGMKMTVAKGFENVEYYGRGPQENYIDRNTGAKLGDYKNTVADMFESKYIKPQENGNRTDVRWTSLTNNKGEGILVIADDVMETSALHYKAEDLAAYKHPYEVPVLDDTILTVDYAQRGLGNASCGPGPLSKYILNGNKSYSHSFRISPLTNTTDKMQESKKNIDSVMPISAILVDGVQVDNFVPNITEYSHNRLKGISTELPVVEVVKTLPDTQVSITQAQAVPGDATITATSTAGITRTYTIHIGEADAIYASDMAWQKDVCGWESNQRDKSNGEQAITIYENGVRKTYPKGIGSHATSDIEINIEGRKYRTFEAIVGIDAEMGYSTAAKVNFMVYVDGVKKFESGPLKAGKNGDTTSERNAKLCKIDVTNAKVIRLFADELESNGSDHADWADAKFTAEVTQTTYPVTTEVAGGTATVTVDKSIALPSDIVTVDISSIEAGKQLKAITVKEADETASDVPVTQVTEDVPEGTWRYRFTMPSKAVKVKVELEERATTSATPSIDKQPTAQTVTEGNSAVFSVTASAEDNGTLTYQWQMHAKEQDADWVDISGATDATYQIAKTTLEDSGKQFRCIVTNIKDSLTSATATSNTAELTVKRASETDKKIKNAVNPEDKTAKFGTEVSKLGLPDAVTVTLEDDTTTEVPVMWNTESYDGSKAGEYTFAGTLVPQAGIINNDNITAKIKVTVEEQTEQPSKEALLALIATAKEMAKDSKYTQASRDALTKAIATAQAVADNDKATEEQIAHAEKALQDAINALEEVQPEKPSKEALLALIASAKEMAKDSKYTQSSRDALTKAIATAQAVADNDNATQQEIASAQKALQAAVKALVKQGGSDKPSGGSSEPEHRKHVEPNMVPSSDLGEKLASSSKGTDISVRSDYKVATGFLNELMKNKDKSVTLNGDWYSWTFDGKKVENNIPGVIWFDTRISTDSPNADAIGKLTGEADTTNLYFIYEGNLPGETVIRVQLEKYAGKPVYVYYHNPEKGRLELIQAEVKADEDGWIEFSITHCSDYVVSASAIKGA